MDWERVKAQLEPVLRTKVGLVRLSPEQWSRAAGAEGGAVKVCRSARLEQNLHFWLETQSGQVLTLAVDEGAVTPAERNLIELLLEGRRGQDKAKTITAGEEERKARLVKDWLFRQLEAGEANAELPEALVTQLGLQGTKIPILLYGDFSDLRNAQYQELKKLLESFFDEELLLIPLQDKEWLILGPESLLAESADGEVNGEAAQQEALTTLCFGLSEMLANEWVGESHLSIHDPIRPAQELIGAVLTMREAILLGKTFDVASNIHLPWLLRLEKLLHAVPERDKTAFVNLVLMRIDHLLDAETTATLEHFFALDCNVSETAKKLYIHRNTLLYRLDKFKQETGLDVRNFGDAVLVKVALLLYKVTKRK